MPITGKQRAQRISRGYHSIPDTNIGWKRVLGVAGLLLGIAYSAWLFTLPGKKQISTGDLSQAHFHLNDSGCDKCHVPFKTIRFDSLWGSEKENVQLNNSACNGACHKVADHFGSRTQPEVLQTESCSRCHQEHLGVHRSLLDIADADCNRCHRDLKISSNRPGVEHPVATDFSTQHPKLSFENLAQDPGTIVFSHIQHMRPGQPKKPGDKTKGLTGIKPEHRGKYQDRLDPAGLIQLKCSDCHERDVPVLGMEDLESFNPSIATGAALQSSSHMLYKPIEFDKHCVACHKLNNELPHGLNRAQTEAALKQQLSALSIGEAENLIQEKNGIEGKIRAVIEDRKERASVLESHISETCKKCHALADESSPDLVLPSNLLLRWLPDASFTHGTHLMVSCKDCHAQAYQQSDEPVQSADEAKGIMIGGLDSCRKCHIQNADERAAAFANNPHVASADCIDCHRYHVDPPLPSSNKREGRRFDSAARFLWPSSVGSAP